MPNKRIIAREMVAFRHALHRRPELGGEEYQTTRSLIARLTQEGIEIVDCGLETGVLALVRGQKPGETIALRADIDALPLTEQTGVEFASETPGVMHACGHDFHTAIVLGAGIALQRMREELCGNVLLVFQPGEEVLLGARQIGDSGVLEKLNVKSMVGIHCTPGFRVGEVGIRRGQFMASSSEVIIKIKGRGGHGAHPQMAVDPVLVAGNIITSLQSLVSREISPLDTLVISICKMQAGDAFNIIPNEVTLEGTVRTLSEEVQQNIGPMIDRLCKGIAGAYRASAETEVIRGTVPLVCDSEVVDMLEKSLIRTIGQENIIHIQEATTGSEDFSEYGKHTKIAYCRIGARGENPLSHNSLHSPVIALDDGAVEVGINVLVGYCMTALNKEGGTV